MTTIEQDLWRDVLMAVLARGQPVRSAIDAANKAVAAFRG